MNRLRALLEFATNADLEGVNSTLESLRFPCLTMRMGDNRLLVDIVADIERTGERAASIFKAVASASVYASISEFDFSLAQRIFKKYPKYVNLTSNYYGKSLKQHIIDLYKRMEDMLNEKNSRIRPSSYVEFKRNFLLLKEIRLQTRSGYW